MDYPKSVPGVGLVDGKFIDENTTTGQVGSLIPCGWGNAVTDEILNVIRAGGEEPTEGEHDQLVAAIRAIVLAAIPEEEVRTTLAAYGITDAYTKTVTYTKTEIDALLTGLSALAAQATESNKGTAKVATDAQMLDSGNDQVIATPKKFRKGFAVSLDVNGYIAFPTWLGGLILQWMTSTHSGEAISTNMPIAFPAACLFAVVNMQTDNGAAVVINKSKTNVNGSSTLSGANTTGTHTYNWLTLGY